MGGIWHVPKLKEQGVRVVPGSLPVAPYSTHNLLVSCLSLLAACCAAAVDRVWF